MAGYFGTKAEAETQDGDRTDEERREEEKKDEGAAGAAGTEAMTAEGELCFTFSVRGKVEREAQEEYLRQMDRSATRSGSGCGRSRTSRRSCSDVTPATSR